MFLYVAYALDFKIKNLDLRSRDYYLISIAKMWYWYLLIATVYSININRLFITRLRYLIIFSSLIILKVTFRWKSLDSFLKRIMSKILIDVSYTTIHSYFMLAYKPCCIVSLLCFPCTSIAYICIQVIIAN